MMRERYMKKSEAIEAVKSKFPEIEEAIVIFRTKTGVGLESHGISTASLAIFSKMLDMELVEAIKKTLSGEGTT